MKKSVPSLKVPKAPKPRPLRMTGDEADILGREIYFAQHAIEVANYPDASHRLGRALEMVRQKRAG